MNKKNHRRNGILRSAFLAVLSLALLPPALGAEARRGAHILVTKNDGTTIQGELLAVRGESLIIMEDSNSIGVTSNLMDVQSVKVIKKTKTGNGIAIGLIVGAAAGAAIGIMGSTKIDTRESIGFIPSIGLPRGPSVITGVLTFGTVGALLGGIIAGGDSRRNVVINVSSSAEIEKTILRLRKLARDQG